MENEAVLISDVWTAVATAFGGVTVILSALFLTLGKVFVTRIARHEQHEFNKRLRDLEAKHQPRTHVHKAQFVKEFDLYSKIWDTVVDLHKGMKEIENRYNDTFENFESAYEELGKRYENFFTSFFATRPFCDNNVFEELNNYHNLTESLIKNVDRQSNYLSQIRGTELEETANYDPELSLGVFIRSLSQLINKSLEVSDSIKTRCREMTVID